MSALRTVTVDGITWNVAPSGCVTQLVGDEFGLVFSRVERDELVVRFTRYSPGPMRSRDASFAALSDTALQRLLLTSQSSLRSPEGGYRS